MDEFDLDLGAIEREIEDDPAERRVVLGVLDGSTPGEEWVAEVERGNLLVLNVEGDINDLAAPFAREVKAEGGELVHFRGFLVVTPSEVDIDMERL